MALSTDISRLTRTIDELAQAITIGLGSRRGLTDQDRHLARAEIDRSVQRLDELRSRLGGDES